jgi:hypothetical protein
VEDEKKIKIYFENKFLWVIFSSLMLFDDPGAI